MRTRSCKAKGRRACQEVREMLLEYAPHLQSDDIAVTSSGVTGEDLKLSPLARKSYPFVFEVKNQERLNIWQAIDQCDLHRNGNSWLPVVVFKRNHEKLRCVIDLEVFLAMLHVKSCKETSPTS